MKTDRHRTVLHRFAWVATAAVLATMMPALPPTVNPANALGRNCGQTSVGFVPISDGLGLYDGGNSMPAGHAAAAPTVVPQNGVIGVASLGMSNTSQEWAKFVDIASSSSAVAGSVRFANGSISGQSMVQWAVPGANVWADSLARIREDGLNASQVQIIWMKMGSRLEELPSTQADRIEQERAWLRAVIANASNTFPNLQRIYLSSRIYAGYASSSSHAEPQTGYDNGLAVRAVAADAVTRDTAVWAAWGPYLWADGLAGRADGLVWECNDFEADGVHPSSAGEEKVGAQLFDFFAGDPTTCGWFLTDPSKCGSVSGGGGIVRFSDVPTSHTFYGDIGWLADSGITSGCNPPANSLFCPDDPLTRGQMAAFLDRALDLPSGPDRFVDDEESVFEPSINAIAAAEITLGCNPPRNSEFCPNDPVTRGAMAAFLDRALNLPPGGEAFRDDDNSIFEDAIESLAEAGITVGCNPPANDHFCPDNVVTRAEMAAFLHRAEQFHN